MFKKSTGLANAIAVVGSIKDALDGAFIYVYDGVEPASADAALSGNTLLMTFSESDDGSTGLTFNATTVSGVLQKTTSEVWKGTVVADGTATFFRMTDAEPTDICLQGDVGTSMLNNIRFTSVALTTSDTRTLEQFDIS